MNAINSCKTLLLLVFTLFCGSLGCGGGGGSDIRYVAIGASDATGIGADPPTRGYVFQIEDGLEADTGEDVELINLGIPGAEIQQMKDFELPAAEVADPDLVTIWAGGNDIVSGTSPESFAEDLDTILSTLRNETTAFIVIGNLPDLTQLPRFQEDPDPDVTGARIAAYNSVIAEAAARYSVPVVQLSDTAPTDVLVSSDGFHPSTEGHEKIAQEFLQVIVPQFSDGSTEG